MTITTLKLLPKYEYKYPKPYIIGLIIQIQRPSSGTISDKGLLKWIIERRLISTNKKPPLEVVRRTLPQVTRFLIQDKLVFNKAIIIGRIENVFITNIHTLDSNSH